MARGTAEAVAGSRQSRPRQLLLSIAAATAYTVLAVVLVRLGVLKPLHALLRR
jgi:hypothetical protein